MRARKQGVLLEGGGSGFPVLTTNADEIVIAIKARDLWDLLEKQSFLCALTGRKLTPATASLDHRIPISKGGAHAPHNLQIVERVVNFAKGTMSQDEFIQVCRDVVEWADRPPQGTLE